MNTFRFFNVLLVLSLVSVSVIEVQAMRRVESLLSSLPRLAKPFLALRAYSLPRVSPIIADKICELDHQIMRHEIDMQAIQKKQRKGVLQEIIMVGGYTSLFGLCCVPVYGLKSLLIPAAFTAALMPLILAAHQLTPHEKRLFENHKKAIKELQDKKVSLFNERV